MSAPKKIQAINGLWQGTATEYHSDNEYISHSMLEDFRDSIPRFAGLFVTKTIAADESSQAQALGTAFHAFLLEPDIVNDLLVKWPEGDGKTAEVQRARKNVCPQAGNAATPKVRHVGARTIVTADQWDQAQRMADSARQHPLVRSMVDLPGYCEQAVRVECSELGKRKARFDKLFEAGHILDLKSTRHMDPKAFAKDAYNLGYFRQAATYEDVRDIAMGAGQAVFIYVATCSEEPFETIVYEVEREALALGREENRELLFELRDRQRRDDWSSRWSGLQRLNAPQWARRQSERE